MMYKKSSKTLRKRILILLAPGFEEGIIFYCLGLLRDKGLPVSLVSMATGFVASQHGLSVKPDLTLDNIEPDEPLKLIVIPGGYQATSNLMADPRIHRLIKATNQQKGVVVALDSSKQILEKFKIPALFSPNRFLSNQDKDLIEFGNELLEISLAPDQSISTQPLLPSQGRERCLEYSDSEK